MSSHDIVSGVGEGGGVSGSLVVRGGGGGVGEGVRCVRRPIFELIG